ncbi:hypothetical protein L1987_59650 [Smallanthus sonchifolius]|uniref:Uncharacterized protein n=1 Tax=Smallanthus sonchifolius TaxID=185202 RepID=A0ACB9D6J6_9ASTR|nr:hypothetical protein L1987_59650 [Smallanthus sonchifolius]
MRGVRFGVAKKIANVDPFSLSISLEHLRSSSESEDLCPDDKTELTKISGAIEEMDPSLVVGADFQMMWKYVAHWIQQHLKNIIKKLRMNKESMLGVRNLPNRSGRHQDLSQISLDVLCSFCFMKHPSKPSIQLDFGCRLGSGGLTGRYKGFHEYAKLGGLEVGSPVGLDVMVDGTVPTRSGLSSSMAFVCSSTIAISPIMAA